MPVFTLPLFVPLKNVDHNHMRCSNETLFKKKKHISFMTELGYEAKSHKTSTWQIGYLKIM